MISFLDRTILSVAPACPWLDEGEIRYTTVDAAPKQWHHPKTIGCFKVTDISYYVALTLIACGACEPRARIISCLMIISLVRYASWRMRSDSLCGTSGMLHRITIVTIATTFWNTSTKANRAANIYQKSALNSYLCSLHGGSRKSR